jgi:hypothetical protein
VSSKRMGPPATHRSSSVQEFKMFNSSKVSDAKH